MIVESKGAAVVQWDHMCFVGLRGLKHTGSDPGHSPRLRGASTQDQFEVLFFDGVAKVLRSTALAKVDSKVCYFKNYKCSLTIILLSFVTYNSFKIGTLVRRSLAHFCSYISPLHEYTLIK
ncbi:hypothetical protein E2C01_010167 [Portunus trituberculatus]|uniref:Uncharacterized protein n=1 Tax=Portunus trituberculatus TaxID=210409 RepID=A0A5B7D7Y9_PORTR|nr:hypothetical protein [Portunus trituberculatus]